MKASLLIGIRQLETREVANPKIVDDSDVIVRINTVVVLCDCVRIARHRLTDNECSVFIHRISLRNEFSTNNAISKNNLQLFYQHFLTIIPIQAERVEGGRRGFAQDENIYINTRLFFRNGTSRTMKKFIQLATKTQSH